jgi:SAM-dependent methyltransferase
MTLRTLPGHRLYDAIGVTYAATRRTEPRIATLTWAALGDARTVLNVGAGTGSYEPLGREVIAVEPSAVMRAQRPPGSARCLAASAVSLPLGDLAFDAAMAVLSDHHWPDSIAGLREMHRVARRVVVFQFDTSQPERFWLTRHYLPEFAQLASQGPPARAGRRDRREHAASTNSLGLRRRVLSRPLAASRGLPAQGGTARNIGMGQARTGS